MLGVRAPDHAKIYCVMSPVGPSFPDGFIPMNIYVDTQNSRSYPGATAGYKCGANYGITIKPSKEIEKKGYHLLLWLC